MASVVRLIFLIVSLFPREKTKLNKKSKADQKIIEICTILANKCFERYSLSSSRCFKLWLLETKSVAYSLGAFLSFLPVDKDLKLSSQSDHRIEISGNIFIRDTLAQSSEVVISGLLVCACAVSLEPNCSYHMGGKKYSPREKQILDIKPCCTRQYVNKTFSFLMKTCMKCLLFFLFST